MDPRRRLTAAQATTHPWLLSKDADLVTHNLGANLEQLKLFNARRKLRAAIKSVSTAAPVRVLVSAGGEMMMMIMMIMMMMMMMMMVTDDNHGTRTNVRHEEC